LEKSRAIVLSRPPFLEIVVTFEEVLHNGLVGPQRLLSNSRSSVDAGFRFSGPPPDDSYVREDELEDVAVH
jgi:hypothetical protein